MIFLGKKLYYLSQKYKEKNALQPVLKCEHHKRGFVLIVTSYHNLIEKSKYIRQQGNSDVTKLDDKVKNDTESYGLN